MANCPQCGAPVQEGAAACKYCGEPFANAPVQQPQRPQQPQQPVFPNPVYVQQPMVPAGINPAWPIKSKIVAGILAIVLGGLGIHKFYLGKTGAGVTYLLFCWTGIPSVIGFFEGLIYLVSNDHNFQVKHHVRLQ